MQNKYGNRERAIRGTSRELKTGVPMAGAVAQAMEQALRYAAILLDISDMSCEDFDELLIEQKRSVVWIHFAVRPSENRRRCNFKR